jgi:hypothetical protein
MIEDLNLSIALLGCRFRHNPSNYLGVALRKWGVGVYSGRLQEFVLVPSYSLKIDKDELIRNSTQRMRIKQEIREEGLEGCFIIKELPSKSSGYQLGKVYCVRGARYNRGNRALWPNVGVNGAQAIFIFYNGYGHQFAVVLAKDSRQFAHDTAWAYAKELNPGQTMTEEQLERYLRDLRETEAGWLTSNNGRVVLVVEEKPTKEKLTIEVDCLSRYVRNVVTENVFINEHRGEVQDRRRWRLLNSNYEMAPSVRRGRK